MNNILPELFIAVSRFLLYKDIISLSLTSKNLLKNINNKYLWQIKAIIDYEFDSYYFEQTKLLPRIRYLQLTQLYQEFNMNQQQFLSIAGMNGDSYLVKYVLQRKGNINEALVATAMSDNLDLLIYLINNGATNYYKALKKAVLHNKGDNINYLQEYCQNLTISALNRLLIKAVKSRSLDLVKYFIGLGAIDYQSALLTAIEQNSDLIIYYLTQQGLNYLDLDSILLGASKLGDINLINYYIELGATDIEGALIEALELQHIELAKFLIDHYDLYNLNDALMRAAFINNLELIQLLHLNGADDLDSALLYSVQGVYDDIIECQLVIDYLVQYDARIDNEVIQTAFKCHNDDIGHYLMSYINNQK